MENKRLFIIGTAAIIGVTTILADVPQPTDPKDAELDALLRKSEEQLQRVTLVAKQVDAVATTHIEEMHENIEQLEQANEILTNEVHEVKAVMESITSSALPFKLEPILPDSTN